MNAVQKRNKNKLKNERIELKERPNECRAER